MSDLSTALIAASSVIAGGMVTGLFTLAVQRNTSNAEQDRWEREAAERGRTRFHETRLSVYTEFLAQASNAHGFLLHQAIERRSQPSDVGAMAAAAATISGSSSEHSEFNSDAARQMTRLRTQVTMLASSANVRDAATELVDAVLAVLAIRVDAPDWNEQTMGHVARVGFAHQRFVDAAGAELAS